MSTNPLTLGRKATPTRKHRPAIWECILGTVYAMNDAGEVRYFDYKWDDAVAFAGVTPERDPRTARAPQKMSVGGRGDSIRSSQNVLWVTK